MTAKAIRIDERTLNYIMNDYKGIHKPKCYLYETKTRMEVDDVEDFVYNITKKMAPALEKYDKYMYSITAFYPKMTPNKMFSNHVKLTDKARIRRHEEFYEIDIKNQDPYIGHFELHIYPVNNYNAVGSSNNNDCLYDALITKLGSKDLLPKIIRTRSKFKKFFGVKRNEPIPFESIYKLEDILINYSINTEGDYNYLSKYPDRPLEINLYIKNGHIKLKDTKRTKVDILKHMKLKPVDEEHFIIYTRNGEKFIINDGNEEKEISYNDYIQYRKSNLLYLVKENKNLTKQREDLIKLFNKFNEKNDINLFQYPSRREAVLSSFMKISLLNKNIEELLPIEHKILKNRGGIRMAQIGTYKNTSCFDMNGSYSFSSINNFLFPYKQPELLRITKEEFNNMKYFKYGYYHVIVHPSNNEKINGKINQIFTFDRMNYYTHYDLEIARKLNLKIEIIEDDEVNFLYYSRDKLIRGDRLFKKYINYWNKRKINETDEEIKQIYKDFLNVLYGSFQLKNYTNYDVYKDDIRIKGKMKEIYLIDDGVRIKAVDEKKYKTPLARIVFLISYQRKLFTEKIFMTKNKIIDEQKINQKINHCIRIHTDSLMTDLSEEETIKLYQLNISNKLGDFKLEEKFKGPCIIENRNNKPTPLEVVPL